MKKLQSGGSAWRGSPSTVIFDVDTGKGVPNVTYVPTLEVPELKFTALTSALDTYEKIREEESKTYKGNMAALNKLYDDVTKVRYDNDVQRQEIETAKQRAGLTEDIFNMSVDQLKNPYIMGPVSRAATDFSNDMGLRSILQEQAMFDSGIASFAKNAPSNPKLREMFAAQVEQYKNGEIKGTDINPQAFMEVDLAGELGKLLKDIPLYTQSELQESGGVISEQEVKQRSQAAIDAVVGYALSNPQWVNNMKARGFMDDNNDLTEDGVRFIQGIRDAYEQASTDIKGITKVKGGVGGTAAVGTGLSTQGLGAARGYEKSDASIFDNYASIAGRYGLDVSTDPETALIIDGALAQTKKPGDGVTPEMIMANTKKQLRQRAMNNPVGGVFAWYEHAVDKGYGGTLNDFVNVITGNGWAAATAAGSPVDPIITQSLSELRTGREQQTWDALRKQAASVPDAIEAAQTPGGGVNTTQQAVAAESGGISQAFIQGGVGTGTGAGAGTGASPRTGAPATPLRYIGIEEGDANALQTRGVSIVPIDAKTISKHKSIAGKGNNPLNMRDNDGKFIKFASLEDGIRAAYNRITRTIAGGKSRAYPANMIKRGRIKSRKGYQDVITIADMIEAWAPRERYGGDNSDAAIDRYLANVQKRSGLPLDTRLKDMSVNDVRKLIFAMSMSEDPKVSKEIAKYFVK